MISSHIRRLTYAVIYTTSWPRATPKGTQGQYCHSQVSLWVSYKDKVEDSKRSYHRSKRLSHWCSYNDPKQSPHHRIKNWHFSNPKRRCWGRRWGHREEIDRITSTPEGFAQPSYQAQAWGPDCLDCLIAKVEQMYGMLESHVQHTTDQFTYVEGQVIALSFQIEDMMMEQRQ